MEDPRRPLSDREPETVYMYDHYAFSHIYQPRGVGADGSFTPPSNLFRKDTKYK